MSRDKIKTCFQFFQKPTIACSNMLYNHTTGHIREPEQELRFVHKTMFEYPLIRHHVPSAKRGRINRKENGDDLPGHIPDRRPPTLASKVYDVEPRCGSDTMHSRPVLWPAAYRQEYPDHTHDAVHQKRRQLSIQSNRAPSEEEPFSTATTSDSSLPQRGNLQCARWSHDSLHSRICKRQ